MFAVLHAPSMTSNFFKKPTFLPSFWKPKVRLNLVGGPNIN